MLKGERRPRLFREMTPMASISAASFFTRLAMGAATLVAAAWAGAASADAPSSLVIAPTAAVCPKVLPSDARCLTGRSATGAWYWLAVPADWKGALVVHAHGGPRTQAPEREDPVEDLERFAVVVKEGFAWAGSTYRRGGYGVRMAAEDTDQLRQIVWDYLGRPKQTLLHGQSWGGNVATKAAELYALDSDGRANYDGVVLTNGVITGGTKAYVFRADLRAVYQFYCHNHPRPNETAYPLWQGLPADATMKRADIAARVQECTGVGLPGAQRSAEQQRNLRNILGVIGIREDQLVPHLAWATNLFQDMVWRRLDGRNPFDNATRVYAGSDDDAALNAGVERFSADPQAVAKLAYDSDLSGLIVAPTLSLHAKNDPTAFVWHEAVYRDVVTAAGRGDLLVQTFTDEDTHSRLSTPEYAAIFHGMLDWITAGRKPTPETVATACATYAARYAEACHFDAGFRPEAP